MNLKITSYKPGLLALLLVTLIGTFNANAQQTTSESEATAKKYNEVQIEQTRKSEKAPLVLDKKQQAEQFKALCPHYPVAKTEGASKENALAYEQWKKSYPQEYEAYLSIFNFKK